MKLNRTKVGRNVNLLERKIKNEINNFPPELKLMILLTIKDIEKREEDSIRIILKETLDWSLFLSIVKYNRTYPIVYKNISKVSDISIPEYVLSKLQQLVRRNTINSLKFTSELIHVIDLLKKNDVKAISLKGPVLGMIVYGDVALRNYSDLDILVDSMDIEKVDKILLNMGYRRFYPDFSLSAKQRRLFTKTNHHFEYHHDKLDIHLEIHWRYYFNNYPLDFMKTWQIRQQVNISGYDIGILSEEDNFLYLVFHGAKHGWFRLRWLCDVYEIIKSNQLDWEVVKEKAKQVEVFHMVLQCMLLVNFFFELDIPHEFKESIKNNKRAYELVEMVIPFIKTIEEEQISKKTHLYMHSKKYMFKLFYGMKNKVKIIVQHCYPILDDFKTIELSDTFFALYFILRPFLWFYRICTR